MDQGIIDFLQHLEQQGKAHDEIEPDHSHRFLNLEPETAKLITVLLEIANTRNVLEIGTSNGYSTIWIASTVGRLGGRVTSIERSAEKHRMALYNLGRVGLLAFVELLLGEATEIVSSLTGPFDCVFFDADRVSAPAQLDLLLSKLSVPALLLADNALSHPEQIAGYLTRVKQVENITHTIVPVGKGLSVAYRRAPLPRFSARPSSQG
jgi:predicted O-methyltransferase YrrM